MFSDFIFPRSVKSLHPLIIYNHDQITERRDLGLKIKDIYLEMEEVMKEKEIDIKISYETFRRHTAKHLDSRAVEKKPTPASTPEASEVTRKRGFDPNRYIRDDEII